ncbi:uncharacterized protein MELLADRAFT_88052 [Melampsora larici-populina 98AG31]|uniref:Uncharacterized protein n=1 Tax=Melampsora larici-populina (strain 98AG31 / pathotype 3-4-7) TaxID=747676 RepID=F4RQ94_MELLP|nr:uncharacterized protein MELLADRAFT_88052 [Melampsora larici-populina 98AG31]EGG05443.1 hypothetical protein MELLADRAFT_88052 [Melampsora larici-populina 98AG31]
MPDHFNSHPIHQCLTYELKSDKQTQPNSISIISTHLQSSFAFHISLNLLLNHRSAHDEYIIIIIPKSQADFNQQINLEADAHLSNLDPQLTLLLGNVQFW